MYSEYGGKKIVCRSFIAAAATAVVTATVAAGATAATAVWGYSDL